MILLTQHLTSETAPNTATSVDHSLPQAQGAPPLQYPASDIYTQVNDYSSYPAPVNSAGSHEHNGNSYLPADSEAQPRGATAYPDPQQQAYHNSYTNPTTTYVSQSYPPTDALPATAAAANAYLNNYPSQPTPLNQPYSSSISKNKYSQYHSPGSPTSWRTWAGNMASTLQPGADYMSSASALMQLGGRSEGPGQQDFAVDGCTRQGWPLMLFGGATGAR